MRHGIRPNTTRSEVNSNNNDVLHINKSEMEEDFSC